MNRNATHRLRRLLIASTAACAAVGSLVLGATAADAAPRTLPGQTTARPFSAGPWTVVNADGGVYWRSAPYWEYPIVQPGVGIYNGNHLLLECYAFGGSVAPYGNTLWYYAYNQNQGSSGWVNDHFLNTPGTATNPQPQTGPC